MATQDAKTAYQNAKTDIAKLLDWFGCELQKEPKNINWAHVGDLNHVRASLLDTLSFLSGFELSQIADTLEEDRETAEADAEIENELKKQGL